MFISNDLLVNAAEVGCLGKSIPPVTTHTQCKDSVFYAIVRPQDRPKVRQWIDAAKTWAPIVYDEERSGGHGYLIFDVLKVGVWVLRRVTKV